MEDSGRALIRVFVLGLAIWWMKTARSAQTETGLKEMYDTFSRWVSEEK